MTTATALKPTTPLPEDQVSFKSWFSVWGALLGAFMAILDIQITNSSLKDIQGALSATLEEGSWISSAYLVAEIVVIPLTGWLAQVFSARLYLFFSASAFIFFSLCCAWAWDLNSMILFRALQGLSGGALIPMAFTIILTTLPRSKQAIGLALFGVTATFAPTIGPTLGGWLTETYSWHYIFYINLIPGIILLASTWYTLEPKPMQLNLLKTADWFGIGCMAIGLGSLQVVLEEGSRKDWFGSPFIVTLSIIAAIFVPLFIITELFVKNPFINLKLLGRRNFGLGSLVNISLGLGLYGSVYILPLYLAQIQGYNAMQIGQVIMWAGLPQFLIFPLVPRLIQKVDLRILLGIGVGLFGISCFMNAGMSHETGADQLMWSQIVRALGQPLIITPLSSLINSDIVDKREQGSASSLFNSMRNLGGSFGIATLSTLLTNREQFHSNRLGEAVSMYDPQTQTRLDQIAQSLISKGVDLVTAQNQALTILNNTVRREAYVMAYNDCFLLISLGFLVSFVVIFFLRKPDMGSAGGGGGH